MADVEYFLKLSGIQGESQHPKHPDEVEVRSWSWGLTSTGIGPGPDSGVQLGRRFRILRSSKRWTDPLPSSPKHA